MPNAQELIENLRFDCWHYRGDRPCLPHRRAGKRCTCDEFQKVVRRGVIIKLGATGDVLRTTPLLRSINPRQSGIQVLWVTHWPELLPPEACEAVHPNMAVLARLRAGPWDFCWNLDKNIEACAIASQTCADEMRGYSLREGVPWPVDAAAWHKFATGIDDPLSKQNRRSYIE